MKLKLILYGPNVESAIFHTHSTEKKIFCYRCYTSALNFEGKQITITVKSAFIDSPETLSFLTKTKNSVHGKTACL